ncbi:MAG: energy-coupling factor transporter transmembrane protein EcfT [Lachnospiraceae bacterium]|nr:energy-coupling factor transporter transmembrane protein EcfT [Lachnospiraceae bacterium]
MKDAFSNYHPIVNLTYFLMVLGCASFLRHPVCLGIALVSSTIYASVLTGKENLIRIIKGMLPMSVMIIIINPLVNHQGVTILGYFRSGNPFTLEACIYGFAAAAIIWSLVQWFVCWNRIMTTEKLIYLFGRLMPALSLVVSMSLRFVPRYQRQLHKIMDAQKQLGKFGKGAGVISRLKLSIRVLSIMTTWAIEHAVETAQSMKGRGYGLPGRTAFSIYRWQARDTQLFIFELVLGVSVLIGGIRGSFQWSWMPIMSSLHITVENGLIFGSYLLLTLLPAGLNGKEEMEWKKSCESNN